MRKMRLELDGLRVESFLTAATEQARGTVQAHGDGQTVPPVCPYMTEASSCSHPWPSDCFGCDTDTTTGLKHCG